ncbi:hypothetical protein NDU88_007110 [Pleurodeles waltl]|uniref:Uncharacterized protein n=1 Tax=Pleurodeles waltl TaxID=8319 RepID=A0AAV7PT61_PLEWA|nr:hypothetical protein NDU88_007110 [Pleurodeles waltl]
MCLPAAESTETRSARQRGEAPGGRLRHWERAALELRQVRRGAARIPLRGNPSRASTSKVPGQRALLRWPGRRQQRLLSLLEAHSGRAEGGRSPPPFF